MTTIVVIRNKRTEIHDDYSRHSGIKGYTMLIMIILNATQ